MKLSDSNISVEQHGAQKEEHFSIGDLGLVLEILRSKLYADPIAAICREITCNARDAHREVGKGDVPIKIVFPTEFDSNYRVIDYGPGISPDRMSNVFIQFASSTKRNTNEQTGGFGLGAKTPFAYGDSFTIITTTDGIKRTYAAFIDETKVGKLTLLHTVSTDDQNSTEIVIPVKPRDFNRFREKTEIAVQYWDVQPNVVGHFNSQAPDRSKAILEGQDWIIYPASSYGSAREHLIIIDGIAYRLDNEIIDNNQSEDAKLNLLFAGSKKILLYFQNGELSLSANRESIHWDEKTKAIVEKRCVELVEELRGKFQVQVDAAKSYVEACKIARGITRAFSITNGIKGYFSWQGHKVIATIDRTVLGMGGVSWTRHKIHGFSNYTRPYPDTLKVMKDKVASWDFDHATDDGDMIVINDINIQNLSPKRVIQILNDIDKSYSTLTLVTDKFLEAKELADIIQYVPYVKLSSYGRPGTKAAKERKAMRMVFRRASAHAPFGRSSAKEFEEDKNIKVYVMLNRGYGDKLYPTSKATSQYSIEDALTFLMKRHSISVYGFEGSVFQSDPDSFEDFTEDAISLEDFIAETLKDVDIPRLKAAANSFASRGSRDDNLGRFSQLCCLIEPSVKEVAAKENLTKFSGLWKILLGLKNEWEGIRVIVDVIQSTDLTGVNASATCPERQEIDALYRQLNRKYPMLNELTSALGYGIDNHSRLMETVANYVDLRTKFETNEPI